MLCPPDPSLNFSSFFVLMMNDVGSELVVAVAPSCVRSDIPILAPEGNFKQISGTH